MEVSLNRYVKTILPITFNYGNDALKRTVDFSNKMVSNDTFIWKHWNSLQNIILRLSSKILMTFQSHCTINSICQVHRLPGHYWYCPNFLCCINKLSETQYPITQVNLTTSNHKTIQDSITFLFRLLWQCLLNHPS